MEQKKPGLCAARRCWLLFTTVKRYKHLIVFDHVYGCHGIGKTGNLDVHFPDRANTGSLTKSIKNFPPTQRKFEVLKIKHSFGGYGLMSL